MDFITNTLLTEQKEPSKDFSEMISILLHSRTQIHTYHWQTKSYAEHIALNGYYDGIVPLVDGLVESYQGKYEMLKGFKNYTINEYKSTNETVKYLKGVFSKIEKLRKSCKDSYIQNQIDTVQELISSTLYKLRFLS